MLWKIIAGITLLGTATYLWYQARKLEKALQSVKAMEAVNNLLHDNISRQTEVIKRTKSYARQIEEKLMDLYSTNTDLATALSKLLSGEPEGISLEILSDNSSSGKAEN